MNMPIHFDLAQYSRRQRWLVSITWLVILAKCIVVWWAVDHWHMPFHPMWVVAPTLVFAGLATALWLTHHEG